MNIKQYHIFLIIILLSFGAAGQMDPDWVLQEIEMKQAALKKYRELEKPAAVKSQSLYDVGYYSVDLGIDIDNREIHGLTIIRGVAKADELSVIELDLLSSLTVDSVRGDAADFQHSANILSVSLAAPIDSGAVFDIEIAYHGNPVADGLDGFSFEYHDNVPIVSTLSEPYFARGWFPCKDTPSDKADSADIILTVPDSLTAVSNGVLVETTDNQDGTATYHWQERYPITTYLISLAVSNYDLIEQTYTAADGTTMPVMHWYYPEYKSLTDVLLLTPDMISFFAGLWGEYPFIKEKYGHAQFAWRGAMEHQTCTSLGAYSELMICHELAHQWWGDMVTCANWKEIWLNEGFARYSEALWLEHTIGKNGYHEYMNQLNRPQYWQSGSVYILDTGNVASIFNLLVYDKGAWILHMLRRVVGDSLFWDIFPAYREAFYMDVATTEDFKNICESIYGGDLDWFFNQWVFGTGQPDYKVSWSREKTTDNEWRMTLKIDQTQPKTTGLIRMPIDIKVVFSDRDSLLTVNDTLLSQTFEFSFLEMPENVIVDPDNWILKTIRYSTIDPDLTYLPDEFLLTNPYPNPFNAAVEFSIYLPYDADTRIVVYDINGRQVDEITGYRSSGYCKLQWRPVNLPSGVYFIRLENSWVKLSRKVVYLK